MPKNVGTPNASIFVKNLPYDVKETDLKDLFVKYGRLRDVYIPLEFHTKEPRGFGYVQFENVRDAEAAVLELKGHKMKGRELDIRFAEGDRKKPGQMVRKDHIDTRRVSSPTRRRRGGSPQRRGHSPPSHTSVSRHDSPPYRRSPPRQRDRSPIRQRSPMRHRSPPGPHRSPPPRHRSPPGPHRSPPPRQRSPIQHSPPPRHRSPAGKAMMLRRQRSPAQQSYRRHVSQSPQRRVRSPVQGQSSGNRIQSPPHRSDQLMRCSPLGRNRSPIPRNSRRSPSPDYVPLSRSKHSMREELIISSRRSITPPRLRRHSSPLTNHRITVSTHNDAGMKDDRMRGNPRQGNRVRARGDRLDERRDERIINDNHADERPTRYTDDRVDCRVRRAHPGLQDHSPPRKRPIRRSPTRLNNSSYERSRFSPSDVHESRVSTRPRGRSPRGLREGARRRSPPRALLETPDHVHPSRDRARMRSPRPRSHNMADRRRARQSDSRRNNDEEYEFVDEEEYYEELDAMDNLDNLDIDFN